MSGNAPGRRAPPRDWACSNKPCAEAGRAAPSAPEPARDHPPAPASGASTSSCGWSSPEKSRSASAKAAVPTLMPTSRPAMSSTGGCMPPQIRDRLVWSEASRYVAHCSTTSMLGPASKTRKSLAGARNSARPPGKYSSPVSRVNTSAAARENAECPEIYPANGGVTKVGRW